MKLRYKLTGIALPLVLLSGAACGVSRAEFDELKAIVNTHRDSSRVWATKVKDIIENVAKCIVDEDCPGSTDPLIPPPPNGGW